jgi:signal transduction histidine kinase
MNTNEINNLLVIVSGFSIISTFILGLIVYFQDKRKPLNIAFGLFTTSLSLWTLFSLVHKLTETLLWARMIFLPIPLMTISLLFFSKNFPSSQKKILKNKKEYLFIFLLILLTVIGVSPLVMADVQIIEGSLHPVFGPFLIPFYLINGGFTLFAAINLIKNYRSANKMYRLRMQYMLVGLIMMLVIMTFMSLIIPQLTNTYEIAFFSPTASILLVVFTAFSIIKYRLWGVKYVVGNVIYLIIIVLSAFFIFDFVSAIHKILWGDVFAFGAQFTGFFITLIIVPLFLFLNKNIKNYIHHRFIYTSLNPSEVLDNLLKSIVTELDINKVVLRVLVIVKESFSVNKVGVVLFNTNNKKVLYKKLIGFDDKENRHMRDLLEVVHFWDFQESRGYKSEILVFNEIVAQLDKRPFEEQKRLNKIIKFMDEEDISVLLPLNRKVQLNGLMIVGDKNNGRAYTVENIDLLEKIIANTSVGVGRALLYKEVNSFNQTLQSKVDEQTNELKEKAKELEEKVEALEDARRRERDMLDILGHELRTPLTTARNAVSFLKTLVKQDKVTPEKVDLYLSKAQENLDREGNLLETMLSTTKIDNQKLELYIEKVDMIDVVNDSLDGLGVKAKAKGLEVKFNKPGECFGYADRQRIQQVVDNIINNAIKYTNEGSVTITLENLSQDKTGRAMVKLTVKDTGQGMSEKAKENLGKKFYRANNYVNVGEDTGMRVVRAGGTGLGLYVTYSLIKMMEGRIEVESEVGVGSEFKIYIPQYTGQKPKGKRKQTVAEKFAQKMKSAASK